MLVELQNVASEASNMVGEGSVRRSRNRSIPQGVVVPDHTPYPHQLQHSLVVVQVVLLVRIHEHEVEGSPVLFLPRERNTK